jgi:hypothetical protein
MEPDAFLSGTFLENTMVDWTRKPQERDGDYDFDSRAYMTRGVQRELSAGEIAWIIRDLRRAVEENDGLDYLQVYEADDGRTVWVIDQLSRSMKENGDYSPEQIEAYDYFTLLLPSEY